MANRLVSEKVQLKTLQNYHHQTINDFGEHETLVDAITNRPGFFGANPVAYLSLMARRPSIQPADLEEALIIDRNLVRANAFRGSLFLLSTDDYQLYFRCFHQLLFQRGLPKLATLGVSTSKLNYFKEILKSSDLSLPLAVEQLTDLLFPKTNSKPNEELCYLILQKLCDMGVLIRTTVKGWKGNDFCYSTVSKWIPELTLKSDNPETARTETIRKYLRTYGPASLEDISWWTGLPLMQCQRSVAHLRREAIRFQIESIRDDMIGLRETVDNIKKKHQSREEIEFLPPWDPYLLGWQCKKRLAEKEWLPFIYDQHGNATSVIVDNGKVIGLWQFKDSEINVIEFHVFAPFKERKKAVIAKLEDWSKSLIRLTGALLVNIFEAPLISSLRERPPGSFLWPLGKPINQVGSKEKIVSPMERRTSNTFRKSYLDNEFLVRPSLVPKENTEIDANS